jgi:hypothetical protein
MMFDCMTKGSISHKNGQFCELVCWIDHNLTGIKLPADRRSRIAAGCFDAALEHQAAVALLCRAELYGSFYSLIRVIFEAYVRGAWFLRCATEDELAAFEKDKFKKTFCDMIKSVETSVGMKHGPLFRAFKQSWPTICSFTHTGFSQVSRRNSATRTGPNYSLDETAKALDFCGAVGLLAAIELSCMANDTFLSQQVLDKAKDYRTQRVSTLNKPTEQQNDC